MSTRRHYLPEKWKAALSSRGAATAARVEHGAAWFQSNTIVGRYVVENLKNERFLDVRGVRALQDIVAGAPTIGGEQTTVQYDAECRAQVRRGGPIPAAHAPQRIGTAVEEIILLEKVLDANSGGTVSPDRILEILVRFADNNPSAIDRRELATLHMATYSLWVTWDADSSGTDEPFQFSPGRCADEIRANLGLSMASAHKPILLVTYSTPGATPILRPTCADAGLYLFFSPPPRDHPPFGLTKPRAEIPGVKEDDFDLLGVTPRPEGLLPPCQFPVDVQIDRATSKVPHS